MSRLVMTIGSVFRAVRFVRSRTVVLFTLAFTISACSGDFNRFGGQGIQGGQVPVSGETIGTGNVRIALLLPSSATGNAGVAATAMRNAAQLAVSDFQAADIQILVKDTGGTPAGAAAAAQAAISEGAELILGPIFAASVASVAPVAQRSRVPVVAFSTDTNVAGRGVYLLSFLPETDIQRAVSYAAAQGRRSFAAILPEGAYGTIAEGALQEAAARSGGRVIAIERYPPDAQAMVPAVQRLAQAASVADAVLIPDGPAAIPSLAPLLPVNGIDPGRVKLLGSGQWDSQAVRQVDTLIGGWYAAPNPAGWQQFQARYAGSFGQTPPRIVTLAYDAVSLAAALSGGVQGQRYTANVLTNPSGFSGIDGIFRFRRNGTNERGLAIIQITTGGGTQIVDPAPTGFTTSGS